MNEKDVEEFLEIRRKMIQTGLQELLSFVDNRTAFHNHFTNGNLIHPIPSQLISMIDRVLVAQTLFSVQDVVYVLGRFNTVLDDLISEAINGEKNASSTQHSNGSVEVDQPKEVGD